MSPWFYHPVIEIVDQDSGDSEMIMASATNFLHHLKRQGRQQTLLGAFQRLNATKVSMKLTSSPSHNS